MNRSQIRDLVLLNTNRSDKTSQINTLIDLGIREIAQIYDFRAVRVQTDLTLAAGGSTVDLPTDLFQMIENVRLINLASVSENRHVVLKEKTQITRDYPDLSQNISGYPEVCFVDWEDNQLVFVPPSSQAWTVRLEYWKLPANLSGEDSSIQTGIETALVAWITAYVFRSIQMFAESKQWLIEYQRALQIAILADQRTGDKRVFKPFCAQETQPYTDPTVVDLPE